jgi:hypothetical protein
MGVVKGEIVGISRLPDMTGILQIRREDPDEDEREIMSLPLSVVFLL